MPVGSPGMEGANPARAYARAGIDDLLLSAYGPWQLVSWSLVYVVYGLMIICVE